MKATRAVRRATWVLWSLTAAAELLLLARMLCVAVWGINGDLSAPYGAPGIVYDVTAPMVNDLSTAANFLVPYNGLHHALDAAALLAMVVLFFATLAITKLALWVAGERSQEAARPVMTESGF